MVLFLWLKLDLFVWGCITKSLQMDRSLAILWIWSIIHVNKKEISSVGQKLLTIWDGNWANIIRCVASIKCLNSTQMNHSNLEQTMIIQGIPIMCLHTLNCMATTKGETELTACIEMLKQGAKKKINLQLNSCYSNIGKRQSWSWFWSPMKIFTTCQIIGKQVSSHCYQKIVVVIVMRARLSHCKWIVSKTQVFAS
jgi:hypothetical protein